MIPCLAPTIHLLLNGRLKHAAIARYTTLVQRATSPASIHTETEHPPVITAMKPALILSVALLAAALPNTPSTTTSSPKPPGFIGQETILSSSTTAPSSSIGSQAASSPAYNPRSTEPPDRDEMLRSKTTYYKCRTDSAGRETEDECGGHAPVLKIKGEAAGPGRGVGNLTGWVIGVGVAAGVFAMGLV